MRLSRLRRRRITTTAAALTVLLTRIIVRTLWRFFGFGFKRLDAAATTVLAPAAPPARAEGAKEFDAVAAAKEPRADHGHVHSVPM